jgi:hypothetical protein
MNENKIEKLQWQQDFNSLSNLVNEWDPVGLVSDGSPIDEYDCLTNSFLSLLYKQKSEEELITFLSNELKTHFGYEISSENFELQGFVHRSTTWFGIRNLKNNELASVKTILENELKEITNFNNAHGISNSNILDHLVEPFKIDVCSHVENTKPFPMWIILQEDKDPHMGYVIAYDLEDYMWALATYIPKEENYMLMFECYTLLETIEAM